MGNGDVDDAVQAGYDEWRKEATGQLNRMCEIARRRGVVLTVGGAKPTPELNPNGTLKVHEVAENELLPDITVNEAAALLREYLP